MIAEEAYIQQRISPRPGEEHYLSFSDLFNALSEFASSCCASKLLDYGCGGSPYRSLFPNTHYLRADIDNYDEIDYFLQPNSRCPAPDAFFDCILSTQVLEHVEDPSLYLQECYRMLQPGGRLFLSSHGAFEDHACPHDYYRWTVHGIQRDLQKVGFQIGRCRKLTAGPRAALYLLGRYMNYISISRTTRWGLAIWLWRQVKPKILHTTIDRLFPKHRVCDLDTPRSELYIGFLVEAIKPDA